MLVGHQGEWLATHTPPWIYPYAVPGKNVRRDPANPTWDPRLIPGGIPPEIGGIPPGIPPGIMERPGSYPTWDPN